MTTTIKEELIGTWSLLSFIELPINGVDSKFPMGQNPKGILIYGADGYMSLQISNSERDEYGSNENYYSEDAMLKCIQEFMAFSGTYKVDVTDAVVQYHITNSFLPNWEGKIQERKIDFEGDILYLKSIEPILSDKEYVNSYMTWQRVDKLEISSNRDRFLEIASLRRDKTQLERK